jgi:hypothetical protein
LFIFFEDYNIWGEITGGGKSFRAGNNWRGETLIEPNMPKITGGGKSFIIMVFCPYGI